MAKIYGNTLTTPIKPNPSGGGGSITVDQTYAPASENAQSGKAINGAIGDIPTSGPNGTVKNLVDYIEQLKEYCFQYTDYKFSTFGEQINGIENGLTSIIAIQNELIARGEGV